MPDDIEFLDAEPAPGEEEYLPQPRGQLGSTLGRAPRVAVGVGVAMLIGGLLVARAVTGNDGTPLASAPSSAGVVQPTQRARSLPVTQPPPPMPSPIVVLDPRTGLLADLSARSCFPSNQIGRTVGLPSPTSASASAGNRVARAPIRHQPPCISVAAAQCPESDDGQIACEVVRDLPPAVLAAVHARYPHARVTFAYTEIARQTQLIWYRVIRLSIAPRASLVVTLVQSGNDPGQSTVVDTPTKQQVYAVHDGPRLNTVVDLIAATSAGTNLGLPTQLVADSRLAAVS